MASRQPWARARSAAPRSTGSASRRNQVVLEDRFSKRSFLFLNQVVIGGSSAPRSTSVAETASSTPNALKISTLDGLLTRATVFLTLKWRLATCSATSLTSSYAVQTTIEEARSFPVCYRAMHSHP